MVFAIAIVVSLAVGFAAGIIFKGRLVAKEQAAVAALKSSATKAIEKL